MHGGRAKGWKVEGVKTRIRRREYKRLREEFQDEGPRVVCGVWLKEEAARERLFVTRGR